jgi:hypothetical protein
MLLHDILALVFFSLVHTGKVFWTLKGELLHSFMSENSGPWCQARSPSRGQTFMHLGMQKFFFQGPKEFSDMRECEIDLWVKVPLSTAVLSILGHGIF